jgi:hypothetical protein
MSSATLNIKKVNIEKKKKMKIIREVYSLFLTGNRKERAQKSNMKDLMLLHESIC